MDFKTCHLLLDGARGIYIPRDFAQMIDPNYIENAENFREDLDLLKSGDVGSEYYWDAWEEILSNMRIRIDDSQELYQLHQDDDLFAVQYE